MAKIKTVDEYIASFIDERGEILKALQTLIQKTVPRALESIKWAQPVYEVEGPFACFKAHRDYVTMGFWRGADLSDPKELLEGEGEKMRHIKIRSIKDIHKTAFQALLRQAVKLNQTEGSPTRMRRSKQN